MAGKAPVYNLTLGEEFGGINRRRPGRSVAADAHPTPDRGTREDGPNEVCAEGPDGLPGEARAFKPETPAQDAPASERIAALIEKMPSHRALMFKIILACENPMQASELNAYVEEQQRFDRSVFGPVELCGLLQRAGALELVDENGDPYERPSCPAQNPGPATGAEDVEEAKAVAAEEAATGAKESSIPGEQRPQEGEDEPDSADDGSSTRPAFWAATEAGLTAARSDDPLERLSSLLQQNEAHASVYKCILRLCARDGGAKTPALGRAVDSIPSVWHPRLFATHFVDQLEKCGAIRWQGAWRTTDVGLGGLDLLGDVEDVEIPQGLDREESGMGEFDYEMPALL